MKSFDKPLYSIYANIYSSGTVLVNDVPVVDWYGVETKEGGFGGDVIINNALLESGKYKVVGKMYPRDGMKDITNEEILSIDFYCADFNNWKQSRHKFHPKIESPWGGLSENIAYPYFEIATEIEVELPFVLDGWQHSILLSDWDKDKLFKEVLNYYQQIRLVLQEHDASKFLEMSQEKMRLQEQAFYFDAARKEDFLNGLAKLFTQNLEVEELNPNDLELQIMGHGRLVRLMRKDGSQPLQFKSPDLEEQSNIELEVKLQMRTPQKGLSII